MTEAHRCQPMLTRTVTLPDLDIRPGTVGWHLVVEEYDFQIRFCPFCGQDLEVAPPPLCGADGPYGPCQAKPGHDGPHMIGWTGYQTVPGYKTPCGNRNNALGLECRREQGHDGAHKTDRTSWDGDCSTRGPGDCRCTMTAGHDGWHQQEGVQWASADADGRESAWEYRQVSFGLDERRSLVELLDGYGREGWEYAYHEQRPSGHRIVLLKRPGRVRKEE